MVYHLTSNFLLYLQNYKEFETEILDLQSEKNGLSFDIKIYYFRLSPGGDENVIGIRAFKCGRSSDTHTKNLICQCKAVVPEILVLGQFEKKQTNNKQTNKQLRILIAEIPSFFFHFLLKVKPSLNKLLLF